MANFKNSFSKSATVLFLIFCLISLNVLIASTANRFLSNLNPASKNCGTYNGYNLYLGAGKAGCYYLNEDNKTIFVNKKLCKCNF